MTINIPDTDQERIVIVGAGFAGLTLANKLQNSKYQIVLLDKNNFHQFQPLFYQVAMAGLEPSSIAFPLRKLFQHKKNVFIRVTSVDAVDTEKKEIITPLGELSYDHLVIAFGVDTNFYGNKNLMEKAIPMKSVAEALYLRNMILNDYEKALVTSDYDKRQGLIDIVVVGGGPTGVEVAGALAEMRKYVLPKDYPELDCKEIDIYLIQSGEQLLKGMSDNAAEGAKAFLEELEVKVILNKRVNDFDGEYVYINDGTKIQANKVIWAAGICGNHIDGLPKEVITYGSRIKVDRYNQIEGLNDIYAIGDISYMEEETFPQGHPQVAQVAIQQAKQLAKNLKGKRKGKAPVQFSYNDKGSMATIGRNRAVVDLPRYKFKGFFAWLVWLVVHLFSLIGVRNKLIVFINWVWNYFTYDQALRLIIKHKVKAEPSRQKEEVESTIE